MPWADILLPLRGAPLLTVDILAKLEFIYFIFSIILLLLLFVFRVSLVNKFETAVSGAPQDVFHLEQMLQILVSIVSRDLLIFRLCHLFSGSETLKMWGKDTMESHFLRYHFIKKYYHFVQSNMPQPPR